MTELSPDKDAGVETDKSDPFRFPSGPSKGRKRPLPAFKCSIIVCLSPRPGLLAGR